LPRKYEAGACEAKWATFTQGGGATVARIFGEAYERGWTPPRGAKAGPSSNGDATHATNGDATASHNARHAAEDDGEPVEIRRWPSPPDDAVFTGLAGEIVRTITPHTESDPVALLVQLLIAFGSVIGRSAHVIVGAARHYAVEFAVLVGETSTARKGSSWSEVYRIIAAVDPDWRDHRISVGLSTGEGLIYHVRDELQGKEAIREKGKITGYQDVIIDHGIPDKRLMILETEFGGVLKVSAREGNRLSAVMRQAWDGGTLATMTKSFEHHTTTRWRRSGGCYFSVAGVAPSRVGLTGSDEQSVCPGSCWPCGSGRTTRSVSGMRSPGSLVGAMPEL
jgi:hypothetical protein